MADVAEVTKQAWAAVKDSGAPESLWPVMYPKIFDALLNVGPPSGAGQQVIHTPAALGRKAAKKASASGAPAKKVQRGGGRVAAPESPNSAITEPELVAEIAKATGVKPEQLEEIFYLDNGVPKINKSGGDLASGMKGKQEDIATLIVTAWNYGFGVIEVPADAVRAEAERFHSLDKNFGGYMRGLDGFVYKGPAKAKVLQVRDKGRERFIELVNKLAPSGSE